MRKGFGANFPRDFMAGIREKIRVPKSPEQPGLIVIAEAFNGYLLARYRASPGSQGLPKIPCRTFSCGLFAARDQGTRGPGDLVPGLTVQHAPA